MKHIPKADRRALLPFFDSLRALACALAMAPVLAHAQAPSQEVAALKAAIVFNLLQFVQWPGEASLPPGSPLAMCAERQGPLWGSLAALQARPLRGQRVLQVREWPASPDGLRECHAVFAEASARRGAVGGLAGQPVLVIGDAERADESGVIIGVRTQGERLSFDIDLGAARRNGLQISSKLLRLAGKVQE